MGVDLRGQTYGDHLSSKADLCRLFADFAGFEKKALGETPILAENCRLLFVKNYLFEVTQGMGCHGCDSARHMCSLSR